MRYYPLDGKEPEWRPYVPQHIGITQYEERLFRLGAYSQYNVWNQNADLIHEFLFFGGNWPKHDDFDHMVEEIDDPEFQEAILDPKKRSKMEACGADLFSFPRNMHILTLVCLITNNFGETLDEVITDEIWDENDFFSF